MSSELTVLFRYLSYEDKEKVIEDTLKAIEKTLKVIEKRFDVKDYTAENGSRCWEYRQKCNVLG